MLRGARRINDHRSLLRRRCVSFINYDFNKGKRIECTANGRYGILLLSIIIGTRDERERGPKILSSFPFDIFFDRYRENNGPYKRPERPQIYRCIPCLVAVEQ